MLKINPSLLILCISLLPNQSWADNEWFTQQDSITNAHKALLSGDLKKSFDAMVEAWQNEPEAHVTNHLNGLLWKGLESDCGRGFDTSGYPSWLNNVVIERQVIQSPGRLNYRLNYRLNIRASTNSNVSEISFVKWPDKALLSNAKLSKDNSASTGKLNYSVQIDRNTEIGNGLYKIRIKTQSGNSWEDWIVLGQPDSAQSIRWVSKDSWAIDKTALLNRFCPLPILDISLYGNIEGHYKKVWSQAFETKYPETLPQSTLPNNRYLLDVSMTHKRWQGLISIEYKQIINKAYDLSN
ncbi:DUF2861 family protein [Vibrio algicola]|uniref:DUF2861 family protein n=1 Tax=Vibrio algicola TaxID=2662262 RepID=A0A5Q0THX7_9VIBR|nr:DUF2861 family protein [Vibrio algicola]